MSGAKTQTRLLEGRQPALCRVSAQMSPLLVLGGSAFHRPPFLPERPGVAPGLAVGVDGALGFPQQVPGLTHTPGLSGNPSDEDKGLGEVTVPWEVAAMTRVLSYVLISCGGWTSVDTNTGKREHSMGGAPGRPLGVARESRRPPATPPGKMSTNPRRAGPPAAWPFSRRGACIQKALSKLWGGYPKIVHYVVKLFSSSVSAFSCNVFIEIKWT